MLIQYVLKIISGEQLILVYDLNGELYDGYVNECDIKNVEVYEIWFSKINDRLMIDVR